MTLERAPTIPDVSVLKASIGSLRVVGGCDCGCASVDFEKDPFEHSQPIADGTGTTARGGNVGIIVSGTSNAITALEVYDLGAGDEDLNLPELHSITSWDQTAA